MEGETFGDKLSNVEVFALADPRADTIAKAKSERL